MRLSVGHRQWIYWAAALLFGSGVLWLICHYFLRVEGEFGPAPHPLEPWALRVHGGAAMLALVVAGSLLPIHMRRAWHQRRNLVPGILLAGILLLLTVTGYALYYFGGEEARPLISVLHWGVGLGAPALLLWHIASGRATLAAMRAASREAPAPAAEPQRAHDGRAG
jgi:hypothetical protein